MAGTSLLALIDDIATLLDDVAILTKVAGKKTAGVLGDDLALNAEQVTGVNPDRELPVVWAVAKGSAVNKAILVPAALAIAALLPWAITPLLMLGGLFLCYEGVEKLTHKLFHRKEADEHDASLREAVEDRKVDLVEFEKRKIKGAIRTDFVLSAEIIAITLGAVATATFTVQLGVLVAISAIMTVGVYGFVAGIVKLDDAGRHLAARGGIASFAGRAIVRLAPLLMKFLSVAGTAAMFLVGGGILAHGIPTFEARVEALVSGWARAAGDLGGAIAFTLPSLANALLGVIAGAIALALVTPILRHTARSQPDSSAAK